MTVCDNFIESWSLEDGFLCDVVYNMPGYTKTLWIYKKDSGIKKAFLRLPREANREVILQAISEGWRKAADDYEKELNEYNRKK